MPIVKISLLDSWSREEQLSISRALHKVLVDVLGIPDSDFNHRILRFNRDTWQLPPGKSDRYVLVEMDLFPGRREETKAKLFRSIVSHLGESGIPDTDVVIIVNEPPLGNWGIRGGVQASHGSLGMGSTCNREDGKDVQA